MSLQSRAKFIKNSKPQADILAKFDKDLADIALLTETEIKNRTPVKTGRLKGSMVAIKNKPLDYEVATNVEYAVYLEYGTSSFAPRAMMRRGGAAIEAFGVSLLKNLKF